MVAFYPRGESHGELEPHIKSFHGASGKLDRDIPAAALEVKKRFVMVYFRHRYEARRMDRWASLCEFECYFHRNTAAFRFAYLHFALRQEV